LKPPSLPRYDREAVGEDIPGTSERPSARISPVRARGRRRGYPRYDREAVGEDIPGTTERPSATRARP